jgi:hypothetical protein
MMNGKLVDTKKYIMWLLTRTSRDLKEVKGGTMKKTRFETISLMIIFVFLIGCATTQRIQEKRDIFRSTIPFCHNEPDCKEKWSAAQVWVAQNCGMKIQIATDSIIETYNPVPRGTTNLAARVIKEPLGGGKYRIVVTTWCDNMFGCHPDTWDAAINFNEYVGRFGTK